MTLELVTVAADSVTVGEVPEVMIELAGELLEDVGDARTDTALPIAELEEKPLTDAAVIVGPLRLPELRVEAALALDRMPGATKLVGDSLDVVGAGAEDERELATVLELI